MLPGSGPFAFRGLDAIDSAAYPIQEDKTVESIPAERRIEMARVHVALANDGRSQPSRRQHQLAAETQLHAALRALKSEMEADR